MSSFWNILSPKANPAPQMLRLGIRAAGLCCAVGYHLRAASCALRANMDHFQESEFRTENFDPIRVARLPDDIFGQERLQRWVTHAVRDCSQSMLDPQSLFDTTRTALVVLAPDNSRPHANSQSYADLVLDSLTKLRDADSDNDTDANLAQTTKYNLTVISQGRAGLGAGLSEAMRLLSNQQIEQVLLIGVDSYLNAADINAHLQAERLLIKGNSNGFLPGEAAAALLLHLTAPDAAGVCIEGIGIAEEVGRPDGSVPSRAQGLTHAIRSACGQAGVSPTELDFRLSDQNGEQFFAREAANAITRIMFGAQKLAHLTLADKIGEVGAATGPAMLAWLSYDMQRINSNLGNLGLIHLANDGGNRCAVVIHHKGEI